MRFKHYNYVKVKAIDCQIVKSMMHIVIYWNILQVLYEPNMMVVYTELVKHLGVKRYF
jgi:hypothetical protein